MVAFYGIISPVAVALFGFIVFLGWQYLIVLAGRFLLVTVAWTTLVVFPILLLIDTGTRGFGHHSMVFAMPVTLAAHLLAWLLFLVL